LLAFIIGNMGEKGLVYTGSSKLMIKFILTELLNSYLNALGSQSQMIVLSNGKGCWSYLVLILVVQVVSSFFIGTVTLRGLCNKP